MSIRKKIQDHFNIPGSQVDDKIRELARELKVCNLDGIAFSTCSGDTMMRLLDKISDHIDANPKAPVIEIPEVENIA